jgi:hypothetical protein
MAQSILKIRLRQVAIGALFAEPHAQGRLSAAMRHFIWEGSSSELITAWINARARQRREEGIAREGQLQA